MQDPGCVQDQVGITCDQDLELFRAWLAGGDELHDTVDDLVVEPPRQPALHEAHMDHGAGSTEAVPPGWGVGHPPGLHCNSG